MGIKRLETWAALDQKLGETNMLSILKRI